MYFAELPQFKTYLQNDQTLDQKNKLANLLDHLQGDIRARNSSQRILNSLRHPIN